MMDTPPIQFFYKQRLQAPTHVSACFFHILFQQKSSRMSHGCLFELITFYMRTNLLLHHLLLHFLLLHHSLHQFYTKLRYFTVSYDNSHSKHNRLKALKIQAFQRIFASTAPSPPGRCRTSNNMTHPPTRVWDDPGTVS